MRSLIDRLGLLYPIFQAPMAGVTSVEMAAIVTKNGCLGALPFGSYNINELEPIKETLRRFKSLAQSSKVNLNFFCHTIEDNAADSHLVSWKNLYKNFPNHEISKLENGNISFKEFELHDNFDQFLHVIFDFEPAVVSFHFGVPSKSTLAKLQSHSILVFATATSIAEVKYLIEYGVDGIVIQGYEAGGHRGNFLETEEFDENLSTGALFAQTIALNPSCYIVPAGGIVNGQMVREYTDKGASACQLGSVFLPAKESNASERFKQSLASKNLTTVMTSLISGKPARCLNTPFIRSIKSSYNEQIGPLPPYGWRYHAYKTWNARNKNPDYGFFLVGQNYHLIEPKESTQEVVDSLISQFKSGKSH